jgi:hypothetical protein
VAEISLKRLHFAMNDRTSRVALYAAFLAGCSLATALALLGAGYTVKNPPALVFLCIAAALAQRGQIAVTGVHKVSISLFPIILAAVLCGPIGAMAVSWRRWSATRRDLFTRFVLYASSRSLTGAVAGLLRPLVWALDTFPSILAATAAAAVCTQVPRSRLSRHFVFA